MSQDKKAQSQRRIKILLAVLVVLVGYQLLQWRGSKGDTYVASNGIELIRAPGVTDEELERQSETIAKLKALSPGQLVNPEVTLELMDELDGAIASQAAKPDARAEGQQPAKSSTDRANAVALRAKAASHAGKQAGLESGNQASKSNSASPLESLSERSSLPVAPSDGQEPEPTKGSLDEQAAGSEGPAMPRELEPSSCTDNLKTVRIEVRYGGEPGQPPCSVWRYSQTRGQNDGQEKKLWEAQWDVQYCLDKARDQFETYQSWGFICK